MADLHALIPAAEGALAKAIAKFEQLVARNATEAEASTLASRIDMGSSAEAAAQSVASSPQPKLEGPVLEHSDATVPYAGTSPIRGPAVGDVVDRSGSATLKRVAAGTVGAGLAAGGIGYAATRPAADTSPPPVTSTAPPPVTEAGSSPPPTDGAPPLDGSDTEEKKRSPSPARR